jgi:TolA-binding protein
MVRFWHCLVMACLLLTGTPRAIAASAETRAFNAAVEAFRLGFYEKAETNFAQFTRNYTNSARVPEAILYEAQARLQLTNYDGAIALLAGHEAMAGTNQDRYVFWLAEARFRKGGAENYRAAAADFARLATNFPGSPRRLEAVIGEATAQSRLSDWPAVLRLLGQTNGVFQAAAAATTNEWVLQGSLLLARANLELGRYPEAEAVVRQLESLQLPGDTAWQRLYLLCQIQLATGRTNDALASSERLTQLATNATQRGVLPESIAFQAGLLEKLGQTNAAIEAYQKNLTNSAPPAFQRQAVWKVTELSLRANEPAGAALVLKNFIDQSSNAPSADLALLALGKLRMRQFLAGATNQASLSATNLDAVTNYLQSALASLDQFVKTSSQTNLLGDVQLERGWCLWLQTNYPAAQAAFEAAARLLPASSNQAVAYFKAADCQFQQTNFAGATANYLAVADKFGAFPEVVNHLVEPALYQVVQANLKSGDLPAASNALARIIVQYPAGFHTEHALLLTGQETSAAGHPAAARELFSNFIKAAPSATLLPEVYLAMARTYEQEDRWTNAAQEYAQGLLLLTNSPNSAALPELEFYRARATFKAGDLTNALSQFTNFYNRYSTNVLAARARMWEGDYYFRNGLYMQAEASYKMVYRTTNNWPETDLTYEAQMWAGRSAMERGAFDAAKQYFTNLYNSASCPVKLRIQALHAYGDCFVHQDSTNKVQDYRDAGGIYNRICENYPGTEQAALAWGAKADALYQMAAGLVQPADLVKAYGEVSNAFQQVIDSTNAPLSARSQAKVGMAKTLRILADQTPASTNRLALLKLALDNCLDVLDGNTMLRDGDAADKPSQLFWRKEAGLEAASLAEKLELWQQALNIYEQLTSLVPAARAKFEKGIQRCRGHLSASAS